MAEIYDIAIIGAGMAGASIAAELAPHARVMLLEAEDTPGYHATGRSAAFWTETYGGPQVQPLTTASGPWLREHGFLASRGALNIAREKDAAALGEFVKGFADSGVRMEQLGHGQLLEHVPHLKPAWTQGVWEPDCSDIDVGGVHQHYLSAAAKNGAVLANRFRLEAAHHDGKRWLLRSATGQEVQADLIVNAAGAWADEVAALAGVRRIGIQPYRRTVLQLRTSPPPPDTLPLVIDMGGQFYFKPENGRLWLSPHDETPSPACDAAPEELDVALAIDRFEKVVDWKVEAVERKWAGLRSFAPDRLPVYGFDGGQENFFWFAGQGGFGIQTAPAAARLASQLLTGLPRDGMTEVLDAQIYSPARFG